MCHLGDRESCIWDEEMKAVCNYEEISRGGGRRNMWMLKSWEGGELGLKGREGFLRAWKLSRTEATNHAGTAGTSRNVTGVRICQRKWKRLGIFTWGEFIAAAAHMHVYSVNGERPTVRGQWSVRSLQGSSAECGFGSGYGWGKRIRRESLRGR